MGASNVDIYIGGIRLPVVEPTFEIEEPHSNQEEHIVGFGGVNMIGKRGLKTFNYSSFYPSYYDSSYCQMRSLLKPTKFVTKMLNFKNGRNKVRLVIAKYKINGLYTIENFKWKPDEGTDDINYTISMKEYRLPTVATAQYAYEVYNFQYTKDTKIVEPQNYLIQEGDTLQIVARKFNMQVKDLWQDNLNRPGILYDGSLVPGNYIYIRGPQIVYVN